VTTTAVDARDVFPGYVDLMPRSPNGRRSRDSGHAKRFGKLTVAPYRACRNAVRAWHALSWTTNSSVSTKRGAGPHQVAPTRTVVPISATKTFMTGLAARPASFNGHVHLRNRGIEDQRRDRGRPLRPGAVWIAPSDLWPLGDLALSAGSNYAGALATDGFQRPLVSHVRARSVKTPA